MKIKLPSQEDVAFCMTMCSVAALHFLPKLIVPTLVTMLFWMLSHITNVVRAKLNLGASGIEVDGSSNTPVAQTTIQQQVVNQQVSPPGSYQGPPIDPPA